MIIYKEKMRDSGSVHGRFQPFHNDHLQYVLAAKERCQFLWIGITKFDIARTEANPLGKDRERPENNPFTFFERINMISDSLIDAGLSRNQFGFVPFPIETPNRLPEFMPLSVPCFTTICEPWNHEKINVLRKLGYEVITLWERDQKEISGIDIRERIVNDDMSWQAMVPNATQKWLNQLKVKERLLELRRTSGVTTSDTPQ